MASRTTGGTYTNKFDITTHPAVLSQIDEIKSSINRIMDPELRVMNGRIDQLNVETTSQFDDVAQQLRIVERELDRVSSRLRMLESFFRSRFFRFLNFFGKWFIYAPDGSIYANTPENRHLVENMRPTPNIDGSSVEESKYRLVDKLETVNLLNGAGERIVLYRYHGTLREAINVLRVRGITPHAGDMLNTLQNKKDYIWVESDNGVNITELGDLPLNKRFPK